MERNKDQSKNQQSAQEKKVEKSEVKHSFTDKDRKKAEKDQHTQGGF